MSSESARCLPQVTGLAAKVNQLLQQHSQPQSEPQLSPTPQPTADVSETLNAGEAEAVEELTDELLEAFPSLERSAGVKFARRKVAKRLR